MVKPTLLQTLLGRPSQTYSFPKEKDYHSTKRELFQIAAKGGSAHDIVPSSGTSSLHLRGDLQSTAERTAPQCRQESISIPTIPQSNNADQYPTDEDDDNDIFYTPDTSPRTSMLSTTPAISSPPSGIINPSLPYHTSQPPPVPSTSTVSLSSTIATSSDSLFAPTFFSTSQSDSTRVVTSVSSDLDHDQTIAKQSSVSLYNQTQSRHVPLSSDHIWSKDVRWLIPPPTSSNSTTARIPKSKRHSFAGGSQSDRYGPPPIQPLHKNLSKSIAKGTPSLMRSMTALMEEDEDRERDVNFNGRYSQFRTPRSSVIAMAPMLEAGSDHLVNSAKFVDGSSSAGFVPSRSGSKSSRSRLPSMHNAQITTPIYPPLPHKRSQSLPHRRSSLTSSISSQIPTLTPYEPSLPSHGTPGYTSLTLPRAPPPASLFLDASNSGKALNGTDGRVDLTRSGIAQTTMASVEVVKGLGAKRNGSWGTSLGIGWVKGGRLERRRTIGGSEFNERRGGDRGREVGRSVSDVDGEALLGFTGHREPPGYVGAGCVLVQVWAVGVDEVDEKLVGGGKGKEKVDVGFIPGRSFVGRVLECGWEVAQEDVKKGEWVVGLLDVRKCGVLTEFIVVDRHRIHRVPYPRMPSSHAIFATTVDPSPSNFIRSPTKSRKVATSTTPFPTSSKASLTLEEYSLLPLSGVPAYRAVRTFVLGLPGKHGKRGGSDMGGRALVLRGHDGAGAMAVQMLVRRGWHVCVHVPLLRDPRDKRKYMKEVEERVRNWGAEDVVFDDGAAGAVIRILEGLLEDAEEFDAILDTVGGRGVWEAGERLLRVGRCGLFTTIVGDVPERAIPSAGDHFMAGLRSLRLGKKGKQTGRDVERNDGKVKGKGKVGYAWVSVAQDVDWEGEDVRESLRVVVGMALEKGVRPWVGRVVPFERAPQVFAHKGRELLRDGGTAVVKIVG